MRMHLRLASALGAATLSTLAAAPAMAAAPVSQAGANAVTVTLNGNEQGTGDVTATNDGSGEQKTGDTTPPISTLQGQSLFNGGVLAQEASATAPNGTGHSAACAGLAGNGGSVAQIGSSRCLNPGDPVGLDFGNLDLSDTVVIDPDSPAGQADAANAPLQQVLAQVSGPLADAVAGTPLASSGLGGSLGVVEASCTSGPNSATGNANIADSKLTLDVAGQEVVLANLPAHPAPNTHVPVNLDAATGAITDAVQTQLETMLAAPDAGTGPLAPLAAAPQAIQDQAITAVVDATREQLLTPLGENVFDLVLNKQNRTGNDQIRVSAIDLSILPAAREQLGGPLAAIQIGNVVCGPSGRVAAAAAPAPEAPAAPAAVPTAVSAGLASAPGSHAPGDDSHNGIVLGAFAILTAGGTALVAIRRLQA